MLKVILGELGKEPGARGSEVGDSRADADARAAHDNDVLVWGQVSDAAKTHFPAAIPLAMKWWPRGTSLFSMAYLGSSSASLVALSFFKNSLKSSAAECRVLMGLARLCVFCVQANAHG